MNKIKNENIKFLTSKLKVQQQSNLLEQKEKQKHLRTKFQEKKKGNDWDPSIIWNGYEEIKRYSLYNTNKSIK